MEEEEKSESLSTEIILLMIFSGLVALCLLIGIVFYGIKI